MHRIEPDTPMRITAGMVRLVAILADGTQLTLAILLPGDTIGRTNGPLDYHASPPAQLEPTTQHNSDRTLERAAQLESLRTGVLAHSIPRYLQALHNSGATTPTPNGPAYPGTQEDLAADLGAPHRTTINRAISHLRRQGILAPALNGHSIILQESSG